jgi:hypothetical protein
VTVPCTERARLERIEKQIASQGAKLDLMIRIMTAPHPLRKHAPTAAGVSTVLGGAVVIIGKALGWW